MEVSGAIFSTFVPLPLKYALTLPVDGAGGTASTTMGQQEAGGYWLAVVNMQ